MNSRLEDYLPPIGRVTIAAALLEETVIRWAALLSEGALLKSHADQLLKGLDQNLTFLADKIKAIASPACQKELLDLIEKGRSLKNERNKSVHGVWGELTTEGTGEFVAVTRSRYKKVGKDVEWDLHTPSIGDLEKIADELNVTAHALNNRLGDLYDIDDGFQKWRLANGL